MATITTIGLIVFAAVILLFWRSYLPKYFEEKAKNLATKEDVEQITEAVERVKNRFQQDNELLRHTLERTNHISKFQFEKEYELYCEIWASLVELKRATISLRPVMDWVDPNESEEDRKKNRLIKFSDSHQKTIDLCEKNRPFYPAEIWRELKELLDVAYKEAVSYRHKAQGRDWEKYWNEAEAARENILNQIEIISVAIRTRLEEFKMPNKSQERTE